MRSILFPMIATGLAAIATAASGQPPALQSVRFAGGPIQAAQLSGQEAVAYGGDGAPLFRGSQAFILDFVGNPSGQVFEWDLAGQRVRVSPAGRPPLWLSCADLAPMSVACAASLRIAADGALMVEPRRPGRGSSRGPAEEAALAALPSCPGDARCPRGAN